jgi:polygalacturonase
MMELKSAIGHWQTGIRIGMPVAGLLWFAGAALAVPALPVINTNNIIVITNAVYGAKFDNSTDNTLAISNAIVAAAAGGTTNGAAGGTVEIPPGTNAYLCGPIVLLNNVNLQIDAGAILRMLPLGQYPGGTNTGTTFISGSNLHDIEISGSGAIDGQGAAWWPFPSAPRPRMISPSSCNRLLIQNVTLSNSPMFHIAISGSHSGNSTVQGVTIQAPSSSPNTDACDVAGTNILVQNCNISVGDDDFTCGGGTSGVLLTNNTYGNGHGISIGSYTDSGGVSNITVVNCTINGAVNGIRIKSDDGRGGLVQNISYFNIGITNVHFPIQIYAYYLLTGTPSSISPSYAATQTVAALNSTPAFRNITFSNINATSVSGYPVGIIWARTEMPATNIVFNKINVTGDRNFCLYNVNGARFIDSKITVSASTTTFALFNAQVIVTNSSPAANLVTFDGLTTNGYANSFAICNAQTSLKNTNVFDDGPLTIGGGKLTVSNNLTLFPTTILNYILGTNPATVSVVSNLTLGGTINITNGVGFTNGTYTVLTYAGKLNGSLPALAGKPAGFNYLYSLNTNTPAKVNLLAQSPPSPVFTAGIVSANGGFSFDVTNGPPSNPVYVLAATNLALPPAQWTPVATNQFDANGQFIFTNAFDPTYPQTFYLLELP